MRTFFVRLTVAAVLLGIGVFYGVELASKGVEQIYGSNPSAIQADEIEEVEAGLNAPPRAGYIEPIVENDPARISQRGQASPADVQGDAAGGGTLHRLASGAGTFLQKAAHKLVEMILSIFDRVFQ